MEKTSAALPVPSATVPAGLRLEDLRPVLQDDPNLNGRSRRKVIKQFFRAQFEARQAQLEACLEINRRGMHAMQEVAVVQIAFRRDQLMNEIREKYTAMMADLGRHVELKELEFLADFAEDLKAFRDRLGNRAIDDDEREFIRVRAKDRFMRVADRLAELTDDVMKDASARNGA